MLDLRKTHIASAALVASLVASFWSSTVLSLALFPAAFGAVHVWILRGIPLLVAAEITAVLTGRKLAGRHEGPLVRRKQWLSRAFAANGALLLFPLAIAMREGPAEGVLPYVEVAAGAVQLSLLATLAATGRALRRSRSAGRPGTELQHAS